MTTTTIVSMGMNDSLSLWGAMMLGAAVEALILIKFALTPRPALRREGRSPWALS
jgi:hypothetical protein